MVIPKRARKPSASLDYKGDGLLTNVLTWDEKMKTRKTLIERLQHKHDNKSWAEFELFYAQYIYNIIRSMGLEHHDAEDLRQQTLVKAWKGLGKMIYEPQKNPFRSWLVTVTKNNVRTFLSKKSTRQLKMNDVFDESQEGLAQEAEIDYKVECEWKLHVSSLALKEIEKRFSPGVMKVFQLLSSGETGERVAAQCGVSVNSVFAYKSRVQNALYKEIIYLSQDLG